MLVTILAALKALPEIVSMIKLLVEEVSKLKQDQIDKQLETIRRDVHETIGKIKSAKTEAERTKLANELATRISK